MASDASQRWPQPAPAVRWLALAQELNISLHTIAYWARRGVVPKDQAATLMLRYAHVLPKSLKAEHLSRNLDAKVAA